MTDASYLATSQRRTNCAAKFSRPTLPRRRRAFLSATIEASVSGGGGN